MFIEFGTSGLSGYGLYFRDGEQKFFRLSSDAVGFFQ